MIESLARNMRMTCRFLPDGRRLHLADGPINLILGADGGKGARQAAFDAASERFVSILDELCAELPRLRRRASSDDSPNGAVARRMWRAVLPHARHNFITPMAAVAGSVAEEILGAMVAAAPLERADVTNGGDIALHLGGSIAFEIGVVDRPDKPRLVGSARINATDPIRGVATSGWRGRSFSLGVADAVTVLADTAAAADAAATIIANAVDLPNHPAIVRRPARELQHDSDLGERLVTVAVGDLTQEDCAQALARGLAQAERLRRQGLISGASLWLAGASRTTGSAFHHLTRASPDASIADAA